MRKWLGVALAMLLIGLPMTAQDKKEQPKADEPVKAADLLKEVMKDIRAFQKENPNDRPGLIKVVDAGFDKFIMAIEDNPKAADIEAMVMGAARFRTSEKASQKLADTVSKKTNLLQGPKPYRMIMMLGQGNPKFLAKVVELNKSKEVAGLVTFMKAQEAMAKFEESEKAEDKELVLKLAAQVPADLVLDLGRKTEIGKQAAAFKDQIEAIENLFVGKPMPELASKDLDGKDVKLSQHKGKVVVLDIWATWCGPCRAMIPHEREMVDKLKDKKFAFISISADDELKTLTDFLEKEKMPWIHWHAGQEGALMKTLNIQHFPTVFVLDHKGIIRYKEIRGNALEDAVEKLVKEAEVK